ncbi:hypothetical protein BDW68DRAFT_152682 [Aspergillus falconensis]
MPALLSTGLMLIVFRPRQLRFTVLLEVQPALIMGRPQWPLAATLLWSTTYAKLICYRYVSPERRCDGELEMEVGSLLL